MRIRRGALGIALVAAALFATTRGGEAHKPITSKYTYNDDVFPILQQRCSRCHVPGGVAPMSLMTYEEAFPWAESIRAELVASHMPPATADESFGDIVRTHSLSAKETDVILTWASGGNPRGALDKTLPVVELKNDWPLGKPDLELPLPAPFTLAADKMEETHEATVPVNTGEARWVQAADLLPGTPAIVRSAVLFVKGAPDQVLARWLPGQDPQRPDGAAFRLPAGAQLVARIRYKKTWQFEGKPMTDRSTIGLYFSRDANPGPITPLAFASPEVPAAGGQKFEFSRTLDRDAQLLAIDQEEVPDDVTLRIEAVTPDGRRTPVVRFMTRRDWMRRFWLAKPLTLPRGTRIEVTGLVEDADLTAAAFGGPSAPAKSDAPKSVKLAIDVVAGAAKPATP